METNNPDKFWEMVNELRTAKRNNYIDNIEPKKWYSWFRELNTEKKSVGNNEFDKGVKSIIKSLQIFTAGNDNLVLDSPINLSEIKRAAKKLKNNKACGDDLISNEMIKCIIQTRFVEVILQIFNLILYKCYFPAIWKVGYIVPIFKGEDSFEPSNYRGIAITSCMGKLFTLILNDRLTHFLEERGFLKPNQIGFRKGYRTADHVFVLNSIINSYIRKGKKVYACFVDFSKDYDSVWRAGLLYKMIKNKLSFNFISVIKSMYDDLNLSVKLTEGTTPLFKSEVGVRQGCNLSPMLFNMFINDLIDDLQGEVTEPINLNGYSCSCLLYADDLLLMSESWEGLCQSMNKLGEYSAKWKLNISSKKTKIMVFSKLNKQSEYSHNIGKITVKCCQDYPYLGSIMTPTNSFIKCRSHLFKQANKAMWGILKEINTHNGGKANTIIKLFNSLVVPVLLYNSEVWGSFLKVKSLHSLTKFKDNLFDESYKHEQLLNRICKYALGIPKKSSNIAAKGELGVYHLNIEIYIRMIKFFFHLGKLIKDGNGLIDSAVKECYTVWKRGDNYSKQLSWLTAVFYLFEMAGHRYYSISNYFELDQERVIKTLKSELQRLFHQHFFKTISLSKKLEPIYSKVKKEFKEESYLSDVDYHKYRSAITKFRISAHNLPIEKGRWNGCDKADRKCTRCINHELGDEKHYLFFCNDPDIVKMRSNFIKENNLKGIQRRNAVPYMETMLSCNQGILTSVGKFLQGIIEVLKDK